MLCHGVEILKERKSNKPDVRLFTCLACGAKWSYTHAAGYFQQGRKPLPEDERKSVVFTVRGTPKDRVDVIRGKKKAAIIEVKDGE